MENKVYLYNVKHDKDEQSFDEAMIVACLQGIINRERPILYCTSQHSKKPEYWLDIFKKEGEWLSGKTFEKIKSLDALVQFAGHRIKGVVIWDTEVPATVNVATTVAGVEDCIVLSPEMAAKHLKKWDLNVFIDFRGRFDGSIKGSAKNEAYLWAIENYLAKGKCSSKLFCLNEDSFYARKPGEINCVVTRDWAVKNRAFVYDLSPWGDELPNDDLNQPLGTDLQTFMRMIKEIFKHSDGNHMTELAGFFNFTKYSDMPEHKSSHHPVHTEWEFVYLISQYNCYQNTITSSCYNQSFHCHFPFKPLKQKRADSTLKLGNKLYICFHMCDYDSATPLYEFMPEFWDDASRGNIPLAWGVNPNLIDSYPDIVSYYYKTASENDYFVADASAAGYFNPNRIQEKYLPLMIRHNKYYFNQTDMTMAPMVLDWNEPTPFVKDAFTEFAFDGYATIIEDFHKKGGKAPEPHVWKGMPVLEMLNTACNFTTTEESAAIILADIKEGSIDKPQFKYVRIVWRKPIDMINTFEQMQKMRPDLDIVPLNPYTFFQMFKQYHEGGK